LWNYFLYVQCKFKVDISFISVYFIQNYEFWKCVFTKVCMLFVVKNMDAQYTKYSINLLNLKHNYKLDMKNSKIQNNRPTSEC
jgi:ABC-type transport system involved in Fe-S cluster assembly fused permease/ATPase subunit